MSMTLGPVVLLAALFMCFYVEQAAGTCVCLARECAVLALSYVMQVCAPDVLSCAMLGRDVYYIAGCDDEIRLSSLR
jgi:hypothetical protein